MRLRRVVALLSSRRLSFWVIGAWVALLVVWLVPFQLTGQSDDTLHGIATDWPPFIFVYVAVLITTVACAALRLARDLKRVGRLPSLTRPLPAAPLAVASDSPASAHDVLKQQGFRVQQGDDRLVAVRRRWSVAGGALFHLGLSVLAAGAVVHVLTFATAGIEVIEGQPMADRIADATDARGDISGFSDALGDLTLTAVEPAYYEDVLLFTQLKAEVSPAGSDSPRDFTLASPLWLDPFTLVSIRDYGFAPHFQVTNNESRAIEEDVIVAMKVFPPGNEDTIDLPSGYFRVTLMVFPDHGVREGRDVSLSYNVKQPMFRVAMEEGVKPGIVAARQLVSLNEPVIGADRTVTIVELRKYATVAVVRSYAWPILLLGAIMVLGGLAARFLFPREDVVLWPVGGGQGVSVRVEGHGPTASRIAAERIVRILKSGAAPDTRGTRPGAGEFAAPDEDAFADRDES